MNLFSEFEINLSKNELISIVGGGGKTTSMFKLARELSEMGKSVLITTTTAIMKPNKNSYDNFFLTDNDTVDLNLIKKSTGITVIGSKLVKDNQKLKGIEKELIDELFKSKAFDYIIVEADGAKRKPIKAPDVHEPVIPSLTTIVIGVIGLDTAYKKIYEENVHRASIFSELTNSKLGDVIDDRIIYNLIVSRNGLFKSTPCNSKKILVLNKVESLSRRRVAEKIKARLEKSQMKIDKIIIGSVRGD